MDPRTAWLEARKVFQATIDEGTTGGWSHEEIDIAKAEVARIDALILRLHPMPPSGRSNDLMRYKR